MAFKTLESKAVFKGKIFNIRRDRVRLPNGVETQLEIFDHSGAVVIVPVDSDGNFWLVRQYRHAAKEELLEFPAGGLEAGEAPDNCARRELQEEAGVAAGRLVPLGGFFLAPGYTTEFLHVFAAFDLRPSKLAGDEDEWLAPEKVASQSFPELARSGQIRDAKTLAAYFLAQPALEKGL